MVKMIRREMTYAVIFFGLFLLSFSLYLANSISAEIQIDKEIKGVLKESVIIVIEI